MSHSLAELRLGQSDVAQKDFDTAVRLVPGLKVRIAEESKKVQSVAKVAAGTSKNGSPEVERLSRLGHRVGRRFPLSVRAVCAIVFCVFAC